MSVIATAWDTYASHSLPADTPAEERLYARRLFYSGAYCMSQVSTEADKLTAADRDGCLAVIRQELSIFAATINTALEGKV